MKVKFGTGNRITIPKDIVNNYKLKEGEFLELNIEDGKLVLTKINNTKDVNKVENYSNNKKPVTKSKIEIKSNIQHKNEYAKPIVSDCGLVVRSKRKYLKEFCNECKGKLSSTSACMYNTKKLASEINAKVNTLNEKLDNRIDKMIRRADTTIQPVKTNDLQRCNKCQSLVFKGFLVDNVFMCTQCTCDDFKEFYKNYYNGGNK